MRRSAATRSVDTPGGGGGKVARQRRSGFLAYEALGRTVGAMTTAPTPIPTNHAADLRAFRAAWKRGRVHRFQAEATVLRALVEQDSALLRLQLATGWTYAELGKAAGLDGSTAFRRVRRLESLRFSATQARELTAAGKSHAEISEALAAGDGRLLTAEEVAVLLAIPELNAEP